MLLLGAGTWGMNDGAHFHASRKREASTLLYFLRMGLILSHEINSRGKRIEYERGENRVTEKCMRDFCLQSVSNCCKCT